MCLLNSLGFSYDWSRELATTDDEYVRWTQWYLYIYLIYHINLDIYTIYEYSLTIMNYLSI
jgi:valyl-tRNA synthetase